MGLSFLKLFEKRSINLSCLGTQYLMLNIIVYPTQGEIQKKSESKSESGVFS